ncbi:MULTISPECIES: GNAT family N-acetyltransferase [Paenibacillus]|uniref:GNAT family N-acetyltransferase n=1 Tax=Paenibacillus campinasensis TaxID=66347 RepID=A0A268EDM7_9BACL|nr:GNAT family N-acetyltransferase [Paenibacillus campinasensis]PAD71232.1 GNAT family N-acetyltransferase [Paenibacillus campinasensis]
MIRYRQPGVDDPAIFQLIQSQLVPLSHLKDQDLDAVLKDVPARLRRGVTLVASPFPDERVIAFVHFMMHGELLYIDMLAVAPAAQRKRWGVRLMAHAERFAVSRGCKRAKVMVDIGNRTGLSFYKKLGYSVTRTIRASQCYEMEKTLS